jgi:hypothetical protein
MFSFKKMKRRFRPHFPSIDDVRFVIHLNKYSKYLNIVKDKKNKSVRFEFFFPYQMPKTTKSL